MLCSLHCLSKNFNNQQFKSQQFPSFKVKQTVYCSLASWCIKHDLGVTLNEPADSSRPLTDTMPILPLIYSCDSRYSLLLAQHTSCINWLLRSVTKNHKSFPVFINGVFFSYICLQLVVKKASYFHLKASCCTFFPW